MTPLESAKTWVGTPYRHQHSDKGFGCDCLGLVRGVYREVVGEEGEAPPAYSRTWGEQGRRELMIEADERHLVRLETVDPHPGDVVIFRMVRGAMAKHCAILADGGMMIHATNQSGVIFEPYTNAWRRRAVAAFRFPLENRHG